MPEPDTNGMNDPAQMIAIEVAKQIPVKDVYDDAAKRGVYELGGLVEDLAKTLRLVLFPVQFTAAYQDRLQAFINDAIRRVPEQRRIAPPPQILGPVLEGVRYEPADTPIADMFSNLLSASCDEERVEHAHPAFPTLIRQLSSDEALLLREIWRADQPLVRVTIADWVDRRFENFRAEHDNMPRSALAFPQNFDFYGLHLYALGISAFHRTNDEAIMDTDERTQTGTRIWEELRLTELGVKLMTAVDPKGADR